MEISAWKITRCFQRKSARSPLLQAIRTEAQTTKPLALLKSVREENKRCRHSSLNTPYNLKLTVVFIQQAHVIEFVR